MLAKRARAHVALAADPDDYFARDRRDGELAPNGVRYEGDPRAGPCDYVPGRIGIKNFEIPLYLNTIINNQSRQRNVALNSESCRTATRAGA
jgi:hypothetical protein